MQMEFQKGRPCLIGVLYRSGRSANDKFLIPSYNYRLSVPQGLEKNVVVDEVLHAFLDRRRFWMVGSVA
jgi:hypothetical protein